ncbi:MAG TPA: hypothetical protein VFQ47_06690 [Nitrososphaera sp.]|nr:hypothetical protein [Nitrososphaera sp.]
MFELTMTTFGNDQIPSIIFKQPEYIAYLHLASIISSWNKVKMRPRLTLELTGRANDSARDNLTMRGKLTRAPVE